MINRRLLRNAILAIFASATTFAACGSGAAPTPTEVYCNKKCNCEKCQPDELSSCNDDITNLKAEANSANCGDEFSAYLDCVSNDAECTDGLYDDSVCFNEETDVHTCIKPPPACASTNDGICDEPPPLGTGKCAAGSDKTDCGAKLCPTTNNGICDEPPPLGTGECPAGSDTLDCKGQTTCPTVDNGVCDEPGGTGTCPTGTDINDCACPYKNNGQCDEPQGTGLCPAGTDTADCNGTCPTTNDGVCDEPQGTGTCPAGTDTNDCSMTCVKCGEFISNGMMGTLCTASETYYFDLYDCACSGGCSASCTNSYCSTGTPDTTCGTCMQSGACSSQFVACINDL